MERVSCKHERGSRLWGFPALALATSYCKRPETTSFPFRICSDCSELKRSRFLLSGQDTGGRRRRIATIPHGGMSTPHTTPPAKGRPGLCWYVWLLQHTTWWFLLIISSHPYRGNTWTNSRSGASPPFRETKKERGGGWCVCARSSWLSYYLPSLHAVWL